DHDGVPSDEIGLRDRAHLLTEGSVRLEAEDCSRREQECRVAGKRQRRDPSAHRESRQLTPTDHQPAGKEEIGVEDEDMVLARQLEDDVQVGYGHSEREQQETPMPARRERGWDEQQKKERVRLELIFD